jgi:hypothetical protein
MVAINRRPSSAILRSASVAKEIGSRYQSPEKNENLKNVRIIVGDEAPTSTDRLRENA